VILGWLGLSLLWKAWRLRRPRQIASPASLPTVHDANAAAVPQTQSARGSASVRGDASG
jgi:hypothetical protein